MTRKTPRSPARVLVEHVWAHCCEAIDHSWVRVNSAMKDAVSLAVEAGLRFAPRRPRALLGHDAR